jgi:hypothetical protein
LTFIAGQSFGFGICKLNDNLDLKTWLAIHGIHGY